MTQQKIFQCDWSTILQTSPSLCSWNTVLKYGLIEYALPQAYSAYPATEAKM